MAKMKLDVAAMKQMLFQKGEKIGLIACLAIMLIVVSYSIYSGFSSRSKTYDTAISEAAKRLEQSIASSTLRDEEKPPTLDPIKASSWPLMFTSFHSLPLFVLPDKAFTKRLNPNVLPILGQDVEKSFHFDYVRGSYFAYLLDVPGKKATVITGAGAGAGVAMPGGGMPAGFGKGMAPPGGPAGVGGQSNLLKVVRPTRMMVVSAIFPMQMQLEEFRKALRYVSVEELLARRDELPRPLGLEVARCEILPGGKASDWTPLFKIEKDAKVTVASPTIRNMMRHMMVDDENPQLLAKYIFPGLVTPLPKMANATYAKVDLRGIEMLDPLAMGGDPNMAPGLPKGPVGPAFPGMARGGPPPGGMQQPQGGAPAGGVDMQTRKEDWKKLTPDLQDKFNEKYFAFDPLAMPPAPQFDPKKGPPGGINNMMPPREGVGVPGQAGMSVFGWDAMLTGAAGGQPGGMAVPPMAAPPGGEGGLEGQAQQGPTLKLNDALVRFFDPDVHPGKTYVYTIRVRMANPNQGRKTEVAFQALADHKEINPFPQAPNNGWVFSPPVTIPGDYYWYALDQAPETKVKNGSDDKVPTAARPEVAPIQVQRWMDRVVDEGNNNAWDVADWAIAERLYTRRGDTVGRHKVMIEMPRWNEGQQMFEIGYAAQASKQPKKAAAPGGVLDSGLPVNTVHEPPYIVVDFEGGKKAFYQVEKRDGGRELVQGDSSAFDILVLRPDGKLEVRNTRADADPESVAGDERQRRFESWRDRLRELRQGGVGFGAPGVPMPPGGRP